MLGEEDLLFRPVMHEPQMYAATALLDGSVDLQFVMLCNEAIEIQQENARRYRVANQ